MIVIDASVWVALTNKNDSCHQKAIKAISQHSKKQLRLFDFAYTETLTVLRNKTTNRHCQSFLGLIKSLKLNIFIKNQKIINAANLFFFHFKKLSFPDCLLMASAKIKNADLLTFDKNLQKAWNSLQK